MSIFCLTGLGLIGGRENVGVESINVKTFRNSTDASERVL